MSSKNAGNQGRRTPLSLNSQTKMIPQQQQGKRPSYNETQHAETRLKLQQKKEEEKKEVTAGVSAVVSLLDETPAAGVLVSKPQQQQQDSNLKNGYNGTESSSKNSAVNSNGNKMTAGASNEAKKEVEIRNKPLKVAAATPELQPVKNGVETNAKVVHATVSSPRKQVQPQQPKPIVEQQKQQQQVSNNEKAIIVPLTSPTSKKPAEEKAVLQQSPKQKKTQLENVTVSVGQAKEPIPEAKTVEKQNVEKLPAVLKEQQREQTATPRKSTVPEIVSPVSVGKKVLPAKKITVTSAIDDFEMGESTQVAPSSVIPPNPKATSTPGKTMQLTSEAIDSAVRNVMVSGRRSIRPLSDWTPSKLESPQFCNSYRRIKTDLDLSETNTSLNVTVGSEPDNNTSWLSFRSRKRERTSTSVENIQDELSPPKRKRFQGLFNVMASPFTILRSRFSKASIEADDIEEEGEEEEEHNVSMGEEVSILEIEDTLPETESKENSPLKEKKEVENLEKHDKLNAIKSDLTGTANTDFSLDTVNADAVAKKRCNIM